MSLTKTIVAIVIAGLYFLMGYKALADPTSVAAIFDVQEISPAMKNEYGAVYGGFGFAFGLSLLVAHFRKGLVGTGVILSLGILTLGMAVGRMVSFCFIQPDNRYPLIFMCVEIVIGSVLVGFSVRRDSP